MQTQATPSSAGACTSALTRLISQCPLSKSAKADLMAGTWTFEIGPHHQVAAGNYALISAAEVREALLQDCQASIKAAFMQGGLLLSSPGTLRSRFYEAGGDDALHITDDQGFRQTLYRDHTRPEGEDNWHPSHWIGRQTREDEQGRKWNGPLQIFITDDFGNLVEVAA